MVPRLFESLQKLQDCLRGWNWYGGGPYYHGWSGGGWIGRSASYANVNVNRNVYINDSYRNVNVNRNINSRNINNYRTDLHRSSEILGRIPSGEAIHSMTGPR
jgi:hypothetical protein